MKIKLSFLLSAMAGILFACSPGAMPETITMVETVVITQIVEGEAVEVIVTATSEPLVIPRQQTTNAASYISHSNRSSCCN